MVPAILDPVHALLAGWAPRVGSDRRTARWWIHATHPGAADTDGAKEILCLQKPMSRVPEEELGERSVGFRFDDDDLDDLKSVRDAVDYVVSRLG